MTAVILTIHSLIVLALIGVVLLQRSDGGALGLGGGGGGGFMTGRGAANALTRTTSILAALFFATSLPLAIRAGAGEDDEQVIEQLTSGGAAQPADDGEITADDLLNSLGAEETAPAAANEPATTEDLLNELGVEAPAAESAPSSEEEAPAEAETPNQ